MMSSFARNSCSAVVPAKAGTQYSRGGCCKAEASIARPVFTGSPHARGRRAEIAGTLIALLTGTIAVLTTPAVAEKSQPLEVRKALYAPWSPDQMAQRRKDYGLIGPGTSKPVPPPAFPSYLKKPDSIEQLMPQARAAVRQTGGRTPLGLVDAGKTALIVVGELRDSKPS